VALQNDMRHANRRTRFVAQLAQYFHMPVYGEGRSLYRLQCNLSLQSLATSGAA
jgi:hypothetical protein